MGDRLPEHVHRISKIPVLLPPGQRQIPRALRTAGARGRHAPLVPRAHARSATNSRDLFTVIQFGCVRMIPPQVHLTHENLVRLLLPLSDEVQSRQPPRRSRAPARPPEEDAALAAADVAAERRVVAQQAAARLASAKRCLKLPIFQTLVYSVTDGVDKHEYSLKRPICDDNRDLIFRRV